MASAVRIGVVGAGLIGGSIIHMVAADPRLRDGLVAHDRDPITREALASHGVALADSLAELADGIDLAIVAVPPAVTPAVVAEVLRASSRVVVADAASVKASVFADTAARVGPDELMRFVPGHPLAGGEARGWEAADADLLQGAMWAICPAPQHTDLEAVLCVVEVVTSVLGGRVLALADHEHDSVLAHTSHMPHLVASALMNCVAAADDPALPMRLSGGALRDATRVAAANPELWSEILRDNAANVTDALDSMIAHLRSFRTLVAQGRFEALAREWRLGAVARERLTAIRWTDDGESVPERCEPTIEALLRIGRRGDLIRRVAAREPELVLELARA